MGDSGLDQRQAPYFEAWLEYRRQGIVSFSTPGHKQGRGVAPELAEAFGDAALALDIPHAGGVDDTHLSRDLLGQAERLAAAAWQADDALFLLNGSTTGNLAFMLAAGRPGAPIVVSRTLHKSLLAGLILSGARPVYVCPAIHPEANVMLDIPPATVQEALEQYPQARAVVLVSPAYTGVSSDLPEIARICHEREVSLFVDEAWGPHFAFHPALPHSAMQAGADAAVTSIHKLLGGLTQTALLTMKGDRITRSQLASAVALLHTTSPAAMLYASIDVARRRMALEGEALLSRTIELAWQAREALAQIPGLRILGPELIAGRPGAGFDPTRILVDVHGLGLTGYQAEAILREQFRIAVEMSDLVSVMLLVTIGDTPETIRHLIDGFTGLAQAAGSCSAPALSAELRSTGAVLAATQQVLTPREAFLAPAEPAPLERAIGRVAAEPITPYPPGIPVIAPGELITPEVVDYLHAGLAAGMYLSGPADPTLRTVRVVAETGRT
ncbi:aminotransferase class I/II-fold pyridoxal phosphate-dependent enzyme [Thermomicrobiaceae bacterium CFH 74404]|uniref:Aminotransferase class I/II-fold pyridoxal phosphate-dependent enzyme n=1 Tax=Thermalbibacter longus TaxID=2951981 RepID=A0AA42BB74_9BACT|nr:aminotransferase class I/II-fold pyridoxal phosphate-dependent enzyme [Thermalbibacter longus]MCM8749519.1 aminotransferase class I/II-fold pyridoxal phosphate-dependent enzyme [Thermalbibacter longus]